ncbi:MAG TPA: hypothetical protein VNG12_04600 [Acidimicrobiales bacterium]|nr:hypothetical protein [Acidimicrobiales bacterium]
MAGDKIHSNCEPTRVDSVSRARREFSDHTEFVTANHRLTPFDRPPSGQAEAIDCKHGNGGIYAKCLALPRRRHLSANRFSSSSQADARASCQLVVEPCVGEVGIQQAISKVRREPDLIDGQRLTCGKSESLEEQQACRAPSIEPLCDNGVSAHVERQNHASLLETGLFDGTEQAVKRPNGLLDLCGAGESRATASSCHHSSFGS